VNFCEATDAGVQGNLPCSTLSAAVSADEKLEIGTYNHSMDVGLTLWSLFTKVEIGPPQVHRKQARIRMNQVA